MGGGYFLKGVGGGGGDRWGLPTIVTNWVYLEQ